MTAQGHSRWVLTISHRNAWKERKDW